MSCSTDRVLKKRRGSLGRRLLFIGGIMGIIIIALTALLAVLPGIPPFKRFILSYTVRQASTLLSCKVTIETITIDLWNGLVVKNIILSDSSGKRKPLRMEKLTAQIDLPVLLTGRFAISSIKCFGLNGEILHGYCGIFAGPVDLIKLSGPSSGDSKKKPAVESEPLVNMIIAERCTVSYTDSMTVLTASESITSVNLKFINSESMSFVLHAGRGNFWSPVWSGNVRSLDAHGIIGGASLLFTDISIRGDSVIVSGKGTVPFYKVDKWDLTANAETFVGSFSPEYKTMLSLNSVGALKAQGAMTGTLRHPDLKASLTGYGLQAGSVRTDSMFLQAQYSNDILNGKARVRSYSGTADASVRADIKHLLSSPTIEKYTVTASTKKVDLRHLIAAMRLRVHRTVVLNDAGLYAAGSGLQRLPDTLSIDIKGTIGADAKSPLNMTLRLAQNKWILYTAMKPDFEVKGNGQCTDSKAINGSLHIQADTISRIISFFSKENARGTITADAHISGTFSKPVISTTLKSSSLNWRYVDVTKLWSRLTLQNNRLNIDTAYLEADGPIAKVLQVLIPGKFDGKAWVRAGVSGPIDSLRSDGDIRLSRFSYDRYHADTISTHYRYADKKIQWQSLYVKCGSTAMHSNGTALWANRINSVTTDCKFTLDNTSAGTLDMRVWSAVDSVSGAVTLRQFDPEVISPWFPQAQRLQGFLDLQCSLTGTSKNPDMGLSFSYDHAVSKGLVLSAAGTIALTDSIATATIKTIQKGSGTLLTAVAKIPVKLSELSKGFAAIQDGAVVTVNGDSVAYSGLLTTFVPTVQSLGTISLHGTLLKANGDWALSCSTHIVNQELTVLREEIKAGHAVIDLRIAGPLARPKAGFTLSGNSINYRGNLITLYSGCGSIDNNILKLDTLHLTTGNGGGADLSAVLPVTLQKGFSINTDSRVSARFTTMPFGFVQPFMPIPTEINKGEVSGRVVIKGTTSGGIQTTGSLSLSNGELYLYECDKALGPLSVDIDFKNDSIILRRLTADWGGGHITGSGGARLDANGISAAQSVIKFNGVHVGGCYENLDLGIQSAEITLAKDYLVAIQVNVKLADTRFTQDYSLIDLAEELKRKAPQTLRPPNPMFDKVAMRIVVDLNSNLTFNSNLGNMLVDGKVTITGRPDNPKVTGQFQILHGYVYYLDRKFTVIQGAIRQYDPKQINPSFDITATSRVPWYPPQGGEENYDLTLLLKGDLSYPSIILTASPSLSQPQIISLLSLGTIQTGGGADLGPRTGALVGQQLAGFGTRKLARILRVESVDISGNIFGSSLEGPQLSVTKQISSRVTVTYKTVLSKLSQQMVVVSLRILSFLYLEGETDQQARGGIDLKFRYSH